MRTDPDRFRRVVTYGLAALLVVVGLLSFRRGVQGAFDFRHFYTDARYVWEHGALNPQLESSTLGEQRQLPFYLPVVPLALAPLTALGRVPAALLWATAQVAALGYCLRVLWVWAEEDAADLPAEPARRVTVLCVAVVLALPAIIEAATFNQLSYFVVALVLAASQSLERERQKTAGLLFAAAAVLKLLPVIFLPWLLLKRRWWAAGALALGTLLISVVPPLLVFGPQRTVEYHRQWWHYNVAGEAARGLLSPELQHHFLDHHNQSIAQVVARLAWPAHPYSTPWQPAQLSQKACTRTATLVISVLAAALFAATCRPGRQIPVSTQRAEIAVYVLAMVAFAPLLRTYYLVWALPALVLLARRGQDSWAARAGLIVWLLGMAAWLSETARLYGAHLIMLLALGVLVLRMAHARSVSVNSVISGRQLKRT